jgi:hypothetical protein
LFIDESFRGREPTSREALGLSGARLLGLQDDFGMGSILHNLKNDLGLSAFRDCEVAAYFGFAALQLEPMRADSGL